MPGRVYTTRNSQEKLSIHENQHAPELLRRTKGGSQNSPRTARDRLKRTNTNPREQGGKIGLAEKKKAANIRATMKKGQKRCQSSGPTPRRSKDTYRTLNMADGNLSPKKKKKELYGELTGVPHDTL